MEHDAARSQPGNQSGGVSVPEAENPVAKEWAELQKLAEKQRESDDAMIAKVLEEAIVSKAQTLALVAKSKPAWVAEFPLLAALFGAIPDETPVVVTDPPDKVEPSDPSNQEKTSDDPETADRLIREAHLWSTRGDKVKAKELLHQAERAAPRSGTVLVALGDAAKERKNLKEAIRLYAAAKDAEPGNIVFERKHADAVFEQTRGFVFDPAGPGGVEQMASAKSAVLLSFMLPGVGQIVSGEVLKGAFFLAMVLGGWAIALFGIGFKGLFALLGMGPSKDASATILFPLAIAAVFHLIAVFDASAKAKTFSKRKIDRPKPPSDLPFE